MKSRTNFVAGLVASTLVFAAAGALVSHASWAAGVIAAPDISQKQPLDRKTVDILFTSPALGGGSLTRYDIWVSDDSGSSWANKYSACTPVNGATPAACWSEGKKVDLLIEVPEASARIVKLRAVADGDAGPWSAPLLVKTKGGRSMRVFVKTPDGVPVSGGSVTWKMADNSVKSSQTYGLTADGYIDFPQVPAGEVQMALTDGELPDGVLVSGKFNAVLGFAKNTLTIPRPPRAVRVVSVTMPNGLPVSGASVSVNSEDMTDMTTLQGFTFKLPNSGLLTTVLDVHPEDPAPSPNPSGSPSPSPSASDSSSPSPDPSDSTVEEPSDDTSSFDDAMSDYEDTTYVGNYDDYYWDYDYYYIEWVVVDYFSWIRRHAIAKHQLRQAPVNAGPVVAKGTTNTTGRFLVKGFTPTIPTATVTYDDGVISQTQTVQLNGALTTVELDYVPYLAATTTDFTADTQTPVSVSVAVNGPATQGVRRAGSSLGKSGVKVAVEQPAGAKAKCKGVSNSATTNALGRATVKFCATVSGTYRVVSKTKGVLSMGAVRVHARKTPPTRVLSLAGKSRAAGALTLTWKKPKDLAGAKSVEYVITCVGGGATKTVTVKSLSASIKKLKHATRYTVTIRAKTSYGQGAASTIRVPVV